LIFERVVGRLKLKLHAAKAGGVLEELQGAKTWGISNIADCRLEERAKGQELSAVRSAPLALCSSLFALLFYKHGTLRSDEVLIF
jgi:hypothetical protein